MPPPRHSATPPCRIRGSEYGTAGRGFSTHDDGNEDENENDLSGDYEEDYDDDCDSASLSRAVTSALHKNSSPAVSPSLPIAAARLLSPPDSPTRMSLNDDVVVSP